MGTGVLARGGIISSVFNRSLRFTQKSRGEIPNGKLVNHISTDTSRIDFCAGFFHLTWTEPIQFIVIMIILIVQIGYSALPGIGFLIVMLPLQTVVMKKLFALRKKSMVWTDKRAKLLQEILGGMTIVKFMAWENPFLDRLRAIRGMELKYVRSLLVTRSGDNGFCHVPPGPCGHHLIHHLQLDCAPARSGDNLLGHHAFPTHANAPHDLADVSVRYRGRYQCYHSVGSSV